MVWHSKSLEDIFSTLHADPSHGHTVDEIKELQKEYGKNSLPETPPKSLIKVFFHQFKSPLIYLLFLASLAAFVMGERNDSIVILFVVLINSLIGTLQEGKAERSMADLRKLSKVLVNVLRDGVEHVISSEELVPGDIVVFNPGDSISADLRIIESYSLRASEAVLTGESVPVEKKNILLPENIPLPERINMLYSGTFITAGRGKAIVIGTGTNTEIGRIAHLTETVREPVSPLHQRITKFSHYLIYASLILFVVIILVGWLQGHSLNEIVMIAISQVVSMIPEGLPVALTVAAAVGMQRMASKKTIVRKLSAVETLGSTSVICSDKTGTLTLNKMTVTKVVVPSGEFISWDEAKIDASEEYKKILKMAVLCNNSQVNKDDKLGDPTESSLILAAEKIGIKKDEYNRMFPRVGEIPFESSVKMMATEHRSNEEHFIAIKGAFESVLGLCGDLNDDVKETIYQMNEQMAEKALRVLAFAYIPDEEIGNDFSSLKGKAIFLGLIGQMDPPREEVSAAIEACRRAGIRPVMITGDHMITGLAIARMIGLAQKDDIAVEGQKLEQLSTDELAREIKKIAVFARVHPSQKLKLVEAFQKAGHVVAMTGDGVNDAPALGKADVGVAMGITGTEVAKEASKIVVTDDNFSTIVTAIAEGRLVYQNIKKVILLLFSTSLAEVAVLLIALISGFAAPYFAVQILWNNLVTDGVITINLIMDPADGTELERPPIARSEPLVTPYMFKRMLFIVPTMVLCTLGWYLLRLKMGVSLEMARTETLTMLVVCQWFNALNCRSETKSALSSSLLKNKWLLGGLIIGNILHILVVYWRPLGDYFHTVPIALNVVPIIALIGSLVLWVEEARKFIERRKHLTN
jgi:calcium-translocating P-type ATPase